MRHIIRQQYLDVELRGAESDALQLTRRLPGFFHDSLAPALERILERVAAPGEHLYIERLEIDAGDLTLEAMEHELVETVTRSLVQAIRDRIASVDLSSPQSGDSPIHRRSQPQKLEEAFLYFLNTGTLPWTFRLPEGSSLEQVLLDSWLEAAKSGTASHFKIASVLSLLASPTVRARLTRQFSQIFLVELFSLLSPEGLQALDEVFQILRREAPSGLDRKAFERQIWETAFTAVAGGRSLPARELVHLSFQSLSNSSPRHAAMAKLLESHWPGITASEAKRIDRAESSSAVEPLMDHADAGEPLDVREGIYIDNAGLVLLHPFLPQFFGALGVASENKLLKPDRALCLLNYLATGQTVAPEYELILPKILCKVPLEVPVESNVELTTAELEESLALLEAVIRHWEALRNTSPDGLRGTFLLRSGKVSLRGDGDWLLQVESKGYDILLDQLPWGISMIKLPWMEKIMWVEWG